MKRKTAELLLSSFTPPGFPQEKGLRKYQFYYDLFSDITEGGIRSSIYQLVEKRYLKRFTLNGQSFFRITDAGIGKLSLLYPSLRIKERKKGDMRGHLLILLKPIADDPHFLKLRKILALQMFSQVTRGVYFYSFPVFPAQLHSLLLDKYSSSVSVAEIKEFSLAIPDQTDLSFQKKKQLQEALSSISKSMMKLIDIGSLENKLNYQSKMMIEDFLKLLTELFHSSRSEFFEEKAYRDLLFQAIEHWNILIELHYFSQKR
ncbi:MAG: hypothetical protein ABI425_03525 [Patescibacteria group bacterium]